MKMKYPKHAYPNARTFRVKKRADVRKALAAISELRVGCAYTPAEEKIKEAADALELAKEMMSVRLWAR